MDKIFVTVSGVGIILFIYWFFFGKKELVVETPVSASLSSAKNLDVGIIVDGGYKPSIINVRKGQKTTLSLLRKDSNSCLEEIVIPDFKIRKYLPLNKVVEIDITPNEAGEFDFHCGMNMFHGKLVVSE
jgi:plastocyanin domain-containing protein